MNRPISINIRTNISPETKKKMTDEFKDLFAAIFKIADRSLQSRLINVINGRCVCEIAKNKLPTQLTTTTSKSVYCQTSSSEIEKSNYETQTVNHPVKTYDKITGLSDGASEIILVKKNHETLRRITTKENKFSSPFRSEKSVKTSSEIISGKEIKLGRTRRSNVPHAKKIDNDTSLTNSSFKAQKLERAKERYQSNRVHLNQRIISSDTSNKEQPNCGKTKSTSQDKLTKELLEDIYIMRDGNLSSNSLNIFNEDEPFGMPWLQHVSQDYVLDAMKKDWENCSIYDDGLLPIHMAVMDGDVKFLKRQCLVLTFRRFGVDLRTEEYGESPLHLALIYKSDREIVKMLLDNGADVLLQDGNGNNCLHLCSLYSSDAEIFKIILQKVQINDLHSQNFEGFGVFHLLVQSEKFNFMKILVDYIDNQLNITSIGHDVQDEKKLVEIYQKFIADFTTDNDKKPELNLNKQKMKLLNLRDIRSGRTALFCAVEKQLESISFLLLAHYADPRIENLAGIETYTISTDVIVNKLISTAIYNTIHILKTYEKYDEKPLMKKIQEKILTPAPTTSNILKTHLNRKRSTEIVTDKNSKKIKINSRKNNKKLERPQIIVKVTNE